MASTRVGCDGFYPTNINARETGSYVDGDSLLCSQSVGGNTFGFCSCSDGVPRFVDQGSELTTCADLCANTPSRYVSDIPALKGSPEDTSLSNFNTFRLEKLALAMAAFVIGCGLLVFHVIDGRGKSVGGERALVQLVKATAIAPSAARA